MSQVVLSPIEIAERTGYITQYPVAASTNVYTGTIGALNSAGYLTYAQDVAGGLIVAGRIESDGLNGSGSNGAVQVNCRRGVFKYNNSSRSSAAYALGIADVGSICYVEDEQTVQNAAGSTYKVKAGRVVAIAADGGVWVDMRITGVCDIALSQNSITDSSTGTAAAPVAGVRTIAAVTSVGTAANAIADLAAELNLVKADLAALKNAL